VKEKLYKGVIMIIYHSSSARELYENFRGYSRGANKKERMVIGDFNLDGFVL